MKKILSIIVLVSMMLITPVIGVNREELYRKFGPVLLEAIVLLIKDEINILRVKAGLSERTNQQILNALEQKYDALELYQWMQEVR